MQPWKSHSQCFEILDRFIEIRKILGALPIVDTEIHEAAAAAEESGKTAEQPKVVTRTRVTADGTYATESVYSAPAGLWSFRL